MSDESGQTVERVNLEWLPFLQPTLSADSGFMGKDEEATLATLKAHREIIDGLIARHSDAWTRRRRTRMKALGASRR